MSSEQGIEIAMADTCLEAFARIPRSHQKSVYEFISKFRLNPRSPGINYETIRNAREPGYRSVRITRDYRGIVLKPDEGNLYLLLWIDKHDDAYAWAERTRCNIHPATGSLQIYEAQVIPEDAPEESTEDTSLPAEAKATPAPPPRPETPLFHVSSDIYMKLGVPEDLVDLVADLRTVEELHRAAGKLPVEAYEALVFLASGDSLQDVLDVYATSTVPDVDTTDYRAAMERDLTRRRFHIFDNDEELLRMLSAPLARWRVYLHPSQRNVVEWDVNGPIRVLGGAGTGKTVVAMHRVNWLVSECLTDPKERVLFTTFTANLAADIEENLKSICSPEALKRIDVENIDAWVSRFVQAQGFDRKIVYEHGYDGIFNEAWNAAERVIPEEELPDLPLSFYKEEWRRVIAPQNIREMRAYFRADRAGRGVGLNRRQRALIWPVFETVQAELARRGAATFEEAVHAAIGFLDEGRKWRSYRAIVVDEAQDLGPEVMTLIRKLVPEAPNDIFIVGDAHQRIYGRKASLKASGIYVTGRARKLRINYRTTEEIRDFATKILLGSEWDDLDGGTDETSEYKSLFGGEDPVLQGHTTIDEEVQWIAKQVEALTSPEDTTVQHADICVVLRTNTLVDSYAAALNRHGLNSVKISRRSADDKRDNTIRLATIHRVKGLGFKAVFVAGASEGQIPNRYALQTSDEAEREQADRGERALLHVACTRAAQYLFISWVGTPSPYLKSMVE